MVSRCCCDCHCYVAAVVAHAAVLLLMLVLLLAATVSYVLPLLLLLCSSRSVLCFCGVAAIVGHDAVLLMLLSLCWFLLFHMSLLFSVLRLCHCLLCGSVICIFDFPLMLDAARLFRRLFSCVSHWHCCCVCLAVVPMLVWWSGLSHF